MNKSPFEKRMWSIALPGYGQYLNGKYFKGTVLLILTVGLIYSSKLTIFGVLLGHVWLPMLFVFPGIIIGLFIRKVINNTS
ncbi:MAG: hypothetical protein ACQEWV_23115 [Bacillota bacterium]